MTKKLNTNSVKEAKKRQGKDPIKVNSPSDKKKSKPSTSKVNKTPAVKKKTTTHVVSNKDTVSGRKPKGPSPRCAREVKNFTCSVTLAPYFQTADVCRKDAIIMSTIPKRYVDENSDSYFIIINLWLAYLEEYSRRGRMCVQDRIMQVGLIPIIGDCVQLSDDLVHGREPIVPSYLRYLISDTQGLSLNVRLQILRFGKRFSPLCADLVEERSIAQFIQVENYNKVSQHIEYPQYIVMKVRYFVHQICGREQPVTLGMFSSGKYRDASRPLMGKVYAAQCTFPTIFPPEYCTPVSKWKNSDPCSRVIAVPKSYKAARIIAQEDSGRQFLCQGYRTLLSEKLSRGKYGKYSHLDDQSLNQQLAEKGSIDGSIATIDLSHASDSVTKSLVKELFPEWFCKAICGLVPDYVEYTYKGRQRRALLHMFATSGNALTFIVEDIVFLAIALAAEEVSRKLGNVPRMGSVSVYGDDIICPSYSYDTTVDFLEALGFSVNADKSFSGTENLYRESCGVECLNGEHVESRYFSRKPLSFSKDKIQSISALCDLQHRLIDVWSTNIFLKQLVLFLFPGMSAHAIGTECSDLWDDQDVPARVKYLIDGIESSRREGFYTLGIGKKILTSCDRIADPRWSAQEAYDLYRYMMFLFRGPRYEDELSSILKISTPDPSIDRVTYEYDTKYSIVF